MKLPCILICLVHFIMVHNNQGMYYNILNSNEHTDTRSTGNCYYYKGETTSYANCLVTCNNISNCLFCRFSAREKECVYCIANETIAYPDIYKIQNYTYSNGNTYEKLQSIKLAGTNYFAFGPEKIVFLNPLMSYASVFEYEISLNFKTSVPDGIIYFVPSSLDFIGTSHKDDFMGVFLREGRVVHSISNINGVKSTNYSTSKYDDDQWHSGLFKKSKDSVEVCIDDVCTSGTPKEISGGVSHVQNVFYFGGVPVEVMHMSEKLMNTRSNFVGCIDNLKVNGQLVEIPNLEASQICM